MWSDLSFDVRSFSPDSWGPSWGLTWEASQETWDTSQGIARNKTTLIKFAPIQDIEQVLYEQAARTEFGTFVPTGESVVDFPGQSCSSYYGSFFGVVQANAFATFRTDPTTTSTCGFEPCADSAYSPVFAGAGASGGDFAPVGEASATFGSVVETTTSSCSFFPQGILNPSDEEMSTLVVSLLTRHRNQSIRRAW